MIKSASSWAGLVTLLLVAGNLTTAHGQPFAQCGFNPDTMSFAGDLSTQTECLLRSVKYKGAGSDPQTVPTFLAERVGKPINIDATALQRYLDENGVNHSEIGGPPTGPMISAQGKNGDAFPALYFVIHDTSWPEIDPQEGFPETLDTAAWNGNDLPSARWNGLAKRVNVIVSRVGGSYTFNDYGAVRQKTATKLELSRFARIAKGRFLHVENIQPRLRPAGSWAHIAPSPGFTDPQYERLALLYIAASVRAGKWMAPAFHFNIDYQIAPGLHAHDDPQNFDLEKWADFVERVCRDVQN